MRSSFTNSSRKACIRSCPRPIIAAHQCELKNVFESFAAAPSWGQKPHLVTWLVHLSGYMVALQWHPVNIFNSFKWFSYHLNHLNHLNGSVAPGKHFQFI